MTLGEKITLLRTTQKMSQEDLAEKLDVSRQSVSKWETGVSIPELDKLVMMSELFHISIDEIVKSDSVAQDTPFDTGAAQTVSAAQDRRSSKQIVGFILLGIGLLGGVFGLAFSEGLLFVSICLIGLAVICIVTKKHTALICGWVLTALAAILLFVTVLRLHNSTSGSMFLFGRPLLWVFLLLAIIMTVATVITARKNRKSKLILE